MFCYKLSTPRNIVLLLNKNTNTVRSSLLYFKLVGYAGKNQERSLDCVDILRMAFFGNMYWNNNPRLEWKKVSCRRNTKSSPCRSLTEDNWNSRNKNVAVKLCRKYPELCITLWTVQVQSLFNVSIIYFSRSVCVRMQWAVSVACLYKGFCSYVPLSNRKLNKERHISWYFPQFALLFLPPWAVQFNKSNRNKTLQLTRYDSLDARIFLTFFKLNDSEQFWTILNNSALLILGNAYATKKIILRYNVFLRVINYFYNNFGGSELL